MSRPTQPEDPGHGLTNYCNFCCVIVKTSIDYWPINDENIQFHPWNQTFTQMKPTTLTDQIKHFHTLNQSLASIKSVTFIEINNILGGTRLNSQRLGQLLETIQSTRQLHLKEEGLNFQDWSSFAKYSGAIDEVWYHWYHTKMDLERRNRGPPWVSPLS
jgi:hypothetical protein